jgi:hypothetical protein
MHIFQERKFRKIEKFKKNLKKAKKIRKLRKIQKKSLKNSENEVKLKIDSSSVSIAAAFYPTKSHNKIHLIK